jgi:hypothetical protein
MNAAVLIAVRQGPDMDTHGSVAGIPGHPGCRRADGGPACFTCGEVADCVDHDHETGYVRGWLCVTCNTRVDQCPHVVGQCPYADYLAAPTAADLGLRYPNRG